MEICARPDGAPEEISVPATRFATGSRSVRAALHPVERIVVTSTSANLKRTGANAERLRRAFAALLITSYYGFCLPNRFQAFTTYLPPEHVTDPRLLHSPELFRRLVANDETLPSACAR